MSFFAGDPYGNLPRPKTVPPARFLNGLSIPTQTINKERHTDVCLSFLVNYATRDTNTMP